MIGKNAGWDAWSMLRHAGLSEDSCEQVAESTASLVQYAATDRGFVAGEVQREVAWGSRKPCVQGMVRSPEKLVVKYFP